MSINPAVLAFTGPVTSVNRFTPDEFEAFALANTELLMEQETDGKVRIMSPVGGSSGNRENQINADLTMYERSHPGESFSASTGFRLPDGSTKSPDAAYVSQQQMTKLTKEERAKFLRVVPEFIVEVRSPSDSLVELEAKMRDTWIANGVRLAWLVDVDEDKLWIYRADHSVELVTPLDRVVSGEDVLPGFTFDLKLLA